MNADKKAFILSSLRDGMSREMLEDALVSMAQAKTYAQARRLITLATK